jgi:hypothetical protein
MPYFKEKEIVFLLGAGASDDAGIPITSKMLKELKEELNNGWGKYLPLYNFIDSNHKIDLNIDEMVK